MQGLETCKIREAVPSDRSRIQAILEAVHVFSPSEVECALSLFDIFLKAGANPDEYVFLIADLKEKETLGFLCYGKASLTDAVYDLYWVATDPQYQNQGIASALMKGLDQHLQELGARMVLAETSSRLDYAGTRRFYLRQGYEIVSTLKDYYHRGDDLVVFGKRYFD